MTDNITLSIDLTPEEHRRAEELAHQRGYVALSDYVRALIETDAIIQAEEFDLDTKEGVMAALKESWHQAMTGHTIPASKLWELLDDQ